MKKDNPFTLNYGIRPQTFIERDYETSDEIISAFEGENPLCNTCLIYGASGSGKTALLTEVSNKLAKSMDWVVVDLNASQPLFSEFTSRVLDASIFRISIITTAYVALLEHYGFGFSDNVSKMEFVLDQLSKQNKRILITVDGAVTDDSMEEMAAQFSMFLRKGYKIYLLMTARFEDVFQMDDSSVPLSLKSIKCFLEPLNLTTVKETFKTKLGVSDEEAAEMAAFTKGYPFAVQTLGALYWEYHDTISKDDLISRVDSFLEEYVYAPIWGEMTPEEKAVIRALPEDGSGIKPEDVLKKLGMEEKAAVTCYKRLVNKGILDSDENDDVSILLPRFGMITKNYDM
jgi:hypothetical protein